ncbi:DUF5947 family protein [Pseudonocardia nantongensis]|uniref:DUF5947 family protein n=1 Tax=Pseudonocardia nantongensis TaxID=1181885 RepID=UPI00397C7F06
MRGLRRFLVDPAEARVERCELCATPVPSEHPHLVQVAERRIRCACGPCALLFDHHSLFDTPGAGGGGYRRVPDRYRADPAFHLDDAQWDALQIPVGMVFFLRNSAQPTEDGQPRVIACYPSPAGATESELSLDAWTDGVGATALAGELEPDVEALLVRREPTECLLVPIDACYRLVGLVRLRWRGFDGGGDARTAIEDFFHDVRSRARTLENRS